ncbi:hypothetical protein AB0M22_45420 [Nocardia sp. NPDC051756]|uniref:hypothetical protein n=1 Tax=Nocardia sp. NPDC051756 TaxID=3154751 RepID=UPI0034173497
MSTTTQRVVHPPFLVAVLGVPAVAIMATAVLLTHDRSPAPVAYQTSTRPDGCVMFCEDVPKASFRDANCPDGPPLIGFTLWTCAPTGTPKPEGAR